MKLTVAFGARGSPAWRQVSVPMNKEQLKDGSEWVEHEDCIVGNEAGLKALAEACNIAIEKGEYFGNNLGDYVGVKKLPEKWFEDLADSPQTRFANTVLGIILVAILALLFLGIYQVISWF